MKRKKIFLGILGIIIIAIGGFLLFQKLTQPKEIENKIISSIKEYGYTLRENKNETYKVMFDELKEILKENPVDEEKYISQISKMFIYDFFSLEDKIAKNDIGGVEFVYPEIVPNFLQNAESTYYKYLESNIYGNRVQDLQVVDQITIDSIDNVSYNVLEKVDSNAYQVDVSWNYTDSKFSDYQSKATLFLTKKDKNFYIVELQ